MDLLEATHDSIVRKVNGKDCTFRFLSAYDRAELLRADLKRRQEAWKERRQRLIDNLTLSGITGEKMFNELEHFEDQTPTSATIQDWIDFVNDNTNEVAILEASLRHNHGDAAKELSEKATVSMSDRAEICGLKVGEEKPDPNPEIPAAYSTPGETSTGSKSDAG